MESLQILVRFAVLDTVGSHVNLVSANNGQILPLLLVLPVGEEGSVSRSVTNLSDSICHGLGLTFEFWGLEAKISTEKNMTKAIFSR